MPVCADMARVLKPSFCPLSSLLAAQSVETKGLSRFLPSSWPGNNRQVKTDERAQPFGAVGRSIDPMRPLQLDTTRSVLSRSEVVYQTFCPGFLRSSISRAQLRVKWKHHAQARNYSGLAER